jgi:hypothetical protein
MTLPDSVVAEEAVLGSVLQGGAGTLAEFNSMLAPQDFTSGPRQLLFEVLLDLERRGVPIDLITVRDELERRGELPRFDHGLELKRLIECVPSTANVVYHAGIVRERADRRNLIAAAERVRQQAEDLGAPIDSIRFETSRPVATAKSKLGFQGVEELLADGGTEAEVEYLVANLVATYAVTLLVARPKVGKTLFVFAMLRALERGELFAGRRVQQASAVVLSEEGSATLKQKVRRFGLKQTRFLTRRDLARCRDFAGVIALAVEEAKRVGARALVIDTLAPWARFARDEEKDAGAVTEAMRPLLAAAAEGLAVIVVHHAKKADALEGDAVRGSGAIFASVETLIELRRLDREAAGSTTRLLVCTSRFDDVVPELCLDLRGDDFIEIDPPKTDKDADLRQRILSVLAAAAPSSMTREEILKAVGGRTDNVGRVLKALFEAEEVGREGSGHAGSPHRYRVRQAAASSRFPFPPVSEGTEERTCDGIVSDSRNGPETRNGDAADAPVEEGPPPTTYGTGLDGAVDLGLDEDLEDAEESEGLP